MREQSTKNQGGKTGGLTGGLWEVLREVLHEVLKAFQFHNSIIIRSLRKTTGGLGKKIEDSQSAGNCLGKKYYQIGGIIIEISMNGQWSMLNDKKQEVPYSRKTLP